tara:strand:- start:183 stop:908 length:726 start_codon:yes stop_codon:yes gene_type:complete
MEFKLPTEIVTLPSQGLLYPSDNPLSSGQVEIKYMTAKEEDILTNANYINNGTVLDKLMKSLIVSDINYDDLLIGDKNAIMVSSRILGYGKDYKFTYQGEEQTVDLTTLDNKEIDSSLFTRGENNFNFTLPTSGIDISFKLLNHRDEVQISQELKGLKKLNSDESPDLTTRLKHMITSIKGSTESKDIREFVENYLLAQDARALRNYIVQIQPDVDLTFFHERIESRVKLPIGLNFFWPDL